MGIDLDAALQSQLIAMADDELVLGHRDSEWCGRAPILEEDIAFANLALDEIGHAKLWYGLAGALSGGNPALYPDQMVFTRPTSSFRSIQMVELPDGDWAFSMLRQYLFDAVEMVRLAEFVHSRYIPLVEASAKIQKEEFYHYRHTRAWVERLGQGTEESHRRMQAALDELWQPAYQIWRPLPDESMLVEAGYLPVSSELERAWLDRINPVLRISGLSIPQPGDARLAPSRQEHTPHLGVLVAELQSVVRSEPQAEW